MWRICPSQTAATSQQAEQPPNFARPTESELGDDHRMTQRRRISITGAASGIGAAICRTLAEADSTTLVHTRQTCDGANLVARQVREGGGEAEVALGDLADASTAAGLLDTMVAPFGGGRGAARRWPDAKRVSPWMVAGRIT
jgi:NAD(P)-dependent dehydrogenase (short-subunit alcohol dehydrogenase family)